MYSNRNEPPLSEKSETSCQNASSLSSRGNVSAANKEGTIRTSALIRTMTLRTMHLRKLSMLDSSVAGGKPSIEDVCARNRGFRGSLIAVRPDYFAVVGAIHGYMKWSNA